MVTITQVRLRIFVLGISLRLARLSAWEKETIKLQTKVVHIATAAIVLANGTNQGTAPKDSRLQPNHIVGAIDINPNLSRLVCPWLVSRCW